MIIDKFFKMNLMEVILDFDHIIFREQEDWFNKDKVKVIMLVVEKFIFHNAHGLTLIFQAESNGNIFRALIFHLHNAGRLVQQGHMGGHHVGGGEVHLSQCTWYNPNFLS